VPLAELNVVCDGKDVILERQGKRLEPVSGQFVLNFEARGLDERVRVMSQQNADELFAMALEYEAHGQTRSEALATYERALHADPRRVDVLMNCGALCYEEGNLEKAYGYFERALGLQPDNALAHFNFGSVLDEMGQTELARQHLRLSVRLDPN